MSQLVCWSPDSFCEADFLFLILEKKLKFPEARQWWSQDLNHGLPDHLTKPSCFLYVPVLKFEAVGERALDINHNILFWNYAFFPLKLVIKRSQQSCMLRRKCLCMSGILDHLERFWKTSSKFGVFRTPRSSPSAQHSR